LGLNPWKENISVVARDSSCVDIYNMNFQEEEEVLALLIITEKVTESEKRNIRNIK
jgi:hypothetical protein